MKRYQLTYILGLFVAALLLAFGGTAPVVRAQTTADGFDPDANGSVFAIVVQTDGKILIGGDFTELSPNGGPTVTRNRIARLNSDGTVDLGFNPNADNQVLSIAVQANGQILAGGLFTNIGGQPRNRIARLDAATGAADPSFDPNANADVESIVVQPDAQILVGGAFTTLGPAGSAVTRNRIARLNTNGTPDAFDPNANATVFSIARQSDGRVLIGGAFTSLSPNGGSAVTRNRIARLETTGALDTAFDPNANERVFSIVVQPDGRVLAGGAFTTLTPNGGTTVVRNRIARLETIGSADIVFNPNANDFVQSIALQPDGKVLAGGFFDNIGGQTRNFIARLDATTGSADSFNPNANGAVNAIAVQPDSKILAGGDFTVIGGAIRNSIARLFPAGPTAASVPVSGRVFASNGKGLRNARVILTDSNGSSRAALSGPFGFYRFEQVATGQTVTIAVRSKRYQFAQRVVSVSEAISALNFFPE